MIRREAQAPVPGGFAGDGEPIPRPVKHPITLHGYLLAHTAGLAYAIWHESICQCRAREPDARPSDGPD